VIKVSLGLYYETLYLRSVQLVWYHEGNGYNTIVIVIPHLVNSMATAIRPLPRALYSPSSIPVFLCPLLRKVPPIPLLAPNRNVRRSKTQKRGYQLESAKPLTQDLPIPSNLLALPRSCPGCGAFTQTVNSEGAGFYSPTRRSVKSFVAQHARGQLRDEDIFKQVVNHADQDILQKLGLSEPLDATDRKPKMKYV